ncbi:MAG: hypothetical protein E6G06_21675 [Actinobacteria bacterium]|nr:MAG: hypothetical protein E6G06_21675 [Actinomycetota bacterium]
MTGTDVPALLGRIGDSISGHKSFGPAFEKDGILLIPVAYVFGGGGGGEGEEPAQPGKDKADKPESNQKKGSGGGYGLVTWPIGAYVVQDGQVRWVPVIDPGLMMTSGALAIAVVVRSLRRKRRRARRRNER